MTPGETHRSDAYLTAPTLLWLHTRPARAVSAVFVAATVASLPNYGGDNAALPWLILAVAVVAAGIVVLLAVRADPMPVRAAAAAAATVPVGALITAAALPGMVDNPNQTNALGAGVALCAFLCVRGRVWTAWAAQCAATAIMAAWGQWTGQGAWAGLATALPNLAVLAMATMFARIMRPAARDVRELRAREAEERADIAASRERDAERARQRDRLQQRAWPSIDLLASRTVLTPAQIDDIVMLEQELRDSIRSPFFDTPDLRAAVRAARARRVEVDLLDDHGMTDADGDVAAVFRALTLDWLQRAPAEVKVTVRVHPPHRSEVGSIVTTDTDGDGQVLILTADGSITSG
ncbi:MAG: hypothetical protein AB1925_08600 [Actinomycetota bacterium]